MSTSDSGLAVRTMPRRHERRRVVRAEFRRSAAWRRLAGGPAVLLLILATLAVRPSIANSDSSGGGTITADTTWTGGEIQGDIVIAPGVTLTLRSGPVRFDGALTVRGNLVLDHSTIDLKADAVIAGGGTLTAGPASGFTFWPGVSLHVDGALRVFGGELNDDVLFRRNNTDAPDAPWGSILAGPGSSVYLLHVIIYGGGQPANDPIGDHLGDVQCQDCALSIHQSTIGTLHDPDLVRGVGVWGKSAQVIVDRTNIVNRLAAASVHVFDAGFVLLYQVSAPELRLWLENGTAWVLDSVFGPVSVGDSGSGHYTFVRDVLAYNQMWDSQSSGLDRGGFVGHGGVIEIVGDIVGTIAWSEPDPSTGQHLSVRGSDVWGGSSDPSTPLYIGAYPPPGHTYTVGDYNAHGPGGGRSVDFGPLIVADPNFVSPGYPGDYHLQAGSPAIGLGPYGTAGQDPPPNYPALSSSITSINPPASAAAGQPVTVTARVVFPGADTPHGTVAFKTSASGVPISPTSDPVLGSALIDASGQATLTVTPPAGSYHIYAWPSSSDVPALFGLLRPPAVLGDLANYQVNPGPADHLVLAPGTATMAAGGNQAYTAEAFDRYGNDVGPVTGSTTLSIVPNGSCSAASCSATSPGPHTVTGTDGTVTGTTSLLVTGGPLDHLVLTPGTATVAAGAAQSYSAEGFDGFGNDLGAVTAGTVFSIAPDGACSANSCTPTGPGPHTVTGTDATKSGTATLTAQATPTISWADPAAIVYGTPLSSTQLNATASVPGTFAYSPSSATVLPAGVNEALSVTFTPTDTANYATSHATVHINVSRATPTVTWATPADIVYGTALGAVQLNAAASVPGTFAYTPTTGSVLPAGVNETLSVSFTPTDTANYSTTSVLVLINVSRATPTITWANPADIVYGTPLSSAQLNAAASVTGTFAYTPANGTVQPAGPQPLSVTFTPADAANYTAAAATVHVRVTPAPLSVTANPASKVYGQPNPAFGASYDGFVNGDTVASLTGTVAFATPATAASGVGSYPVTPSGLTSNNYTIAYHDGHLTVTPALLAVTADNQTRVYGQANPPLTYTITGFVNADARVGRLRHPDPVHRRHRLVQRGHLPDHRHPGDPGCRQLHLRLRSRNSVGDSGPLDRRRRQPDPGVRPGQPATHLYHHRLRQRRRRHRCLRQPGAGHRRHHVVQRRRLPDHHHRRHPGGGQLPLRARSRNPHRHPGANRAQRLARRATPPTAGDHDRDGIGETHLR